MSIHLHKFVDRLRGLESRGVKDFTMSMTDAKDLHADITRLLIDLQSLKQQIVSQTANEQPITVEIQGGSFR